MFNTLSWESIENYLLDKDLKKLRKSYKDFLITTYLRDPDNLEFVHKSFQEYLSAEYLFICFLSGRLEGLYAFPLTQEILEFLRGLAKMYSECFKSEFFESEKLEEFKELLKLAGKLKLENESRECSNIISKLYTAEKIDGVVNIIRNIGMEINPNKLKEEAKSYLVKECYVPNIHTENYPNLNVKFCKVGYEVKMGIETIIKTLVSGKIAVVEIGQALSNNEFLRDLNELEKGALAEALRYNHLFRLNLGG